VYTFNSGLGLRLRDLECLRGKPWIAPLYLSLLHFFAPLVMWGVGSPFFGPEAVMGFIFIGMMPMAVCSIMWTEIHRGNVTLVTAFIMVDTLVAPFLIPYALQLFSGAGVRLDSLRMVWGLFWMLLFPIMLALVLNHLSRGGLRRRAGNCLSMLSKTAMLGLFLINGGVTAPFFLDISLSTLCLFGMAVFVSALMFVMNYGLGRLLFSRIEDLLAFMLGASMRTLTTGMVLAMTYFTPLTTFTVLLAMIVQQPLGSLAGKIAARRW
jgi:predicted Na+-dependent transporter